ncbi:MAG: DNA-deoxyinosine glycosylase [Clostridia bacterium]|nr:DNA-deoxyinosine glycosylase [Clostridia bacterium]
MIIHPIKPVFDSNSEILILGSFPSVKSREEGFFYGHPQNRFWKVVATVFDSPVPQTVEEKRRFLLANRIAVWDVIKSCEIEGSADSTIKDVIPNDLSVILNNAPIKQIFVNGKTAEMYYKRLIEPTIHRSAVWLPSTSPANATYSPKKLIESWKQIAINE